MIRKNQLPRALALLPIAILTAIVFTGCSSSEASSAADKGQPSAFAALEPGWNTFEPGGETTCSDGSTFRFFARPGDPEKLLVYLQGGGGCWNGATCDPDKNPTYSVQARKQLIEAKPGEPRPERAMNGIFDYTREGNPFRDYSAVFIPYCTGDVHLGNRSVTYQAPASDDHEAHEFTVHHKGFVNAMAALDWSFATFEAPQKIFVTGSSAGSIPSPYYAHRVKDRYPEASVTQLGDGSGGYRRSTDSDRPDRPWGTQDIIADVPYLATLPTEEFNYEALYIGVAKEHPDIQFAQYDAAEDRVQLRFLKIGGSDASKLQPLLDANRADIEAEVDNFVSYTASGDSHTILGRESFYDLEVGGTAFRDWLAALAEGEAIANVHCGECPVQTEEQATEE